MKTMTRLKIATSIWDGDENNPVPPLLLPLDVPVEGVPELLPVPVEVDGPDADDVDDDVEDVEFEFDVAAELDELDARDNSYAVVTNCPFSPASPKICQ